MFMESITPEWLRKRGGLHDARVLDVRWVTSNLEISFDDVWSNERELSVPPGRDPGTLVLEDAILVEGDLSAAEDGWVSSIEMVGSEVHFDFFRSPVLVFHAARVHWRPVEQQSFSTRR
jgi:hypothetical protein